MTQMVIMFCSIQNDKYRNFRELHASSPPDYADLKTILDFVSKNGHGLMFVSQEFKQNPEVVLSAISQNVHALQYADKILLEDDSFMLEAIRCNGIAYQYASDELKNDRSFQESSVALNRLAILNIATTANDLKIIQSINITKNSLQQHSLYHFGRTSKEQLEGAAFFPNV